MGLRYMVDLGVEAVVADDAADRRSYAAEGHLTELRVIFIEDI